MIRPYLSCPTPDPHHVILPVTEAVRHLVPDHVQVSVDGDLPDLVLLLEGKVTLEGPLLRFFMQKVVRV